jgi:hypothetical protein
MVIARLLPVALLPLMFACQATATSTQFRRRTSQTQEQAQAAQLHSLRIREADTYLAQQEQMVRLLQDEGDMSVPPSAPSAPSPVMAPSAVAPIAPPVAAPSSPVPAPSKPVPAPSSPVPAPSKPVPAPSSPVAPTAPGQCVLQLNIACTLDNGASCEDYQPVLEACSGPPSLIGMRYNGGGCDQSNNGQDDSTFRCEDFGNGPPTTKGTPSYIVVTDALENGNVLYQNWVEVNKFFNVSYSGAADGTTETYVYIYSTQDQSESNLLQFLRFDSSCSSPLDLGNEFGSVEVTSWTNADQGYVSAFTGVNIEASVQIQGEQGDGTLTLSSLVIETSFAGTIDLSLLVSGQTIPTGEASLTVPVPTNIDITQPQSYSFKISLAGTSNTGESCSGTFEQTYTIGASQ